MIYLGDFEADQAVYFAWNTNDGDGASITRATDGTISVYKDNSDGSSFDVTQVTTGITNDEDFDALVGVHTCCITTTDAWYEVGHSYMVVLSASTIDTQSVSAVLAHFSIENRFMRGTDSANTTTPPTVTQIRTEMDTNSSRLDADISSRNATTPPTVGLIRTEMEGAGTKLLAIEGYTDKIDDAVNGLTAIKAEVEGLGGEAMRGTNSAALNADKGDWATAVGFSTHDAAAVKTAIEAAGSSIATILADMIAVDVLTEAGGAGDLTAIKSAIDGIRYISESGGSGDLTAIKSAIDGVRHVSESGGSGDLTAIKTQVDALLSLERESATPTITSAETTLYEDATPTKNKMGVVVKIDMAAMQAGDTFVVKEKYKDESGGAYQEIDSMTYTGVQSKPLRIIALTPYRYGAIITMQKTAGTDRIIEWESFVEE